MQATQLTSVLPCGVAGLALTTTRSLRRLGVNAGPEWHQLPWASAAVWCQCRPAADSLGKPLRSDQLWSSEAPCIHHGKISQCFFVPGRRHLEKGRAPREEVAFRKAPRVVLRYLERWTASRRKPALDGSDEIHLGKKQKFIKVVSNLDTGEPLWVWAATEEGNAGQPLSKPN